MAHAPARMFVTKALHSLTPPVLAVPAYRRLWHSSLLYYHAYHFEIVTAGWVVLVLTGSPVSVGVAGFCRTIPMFVLGLVFGTVADRFRRTDVLLTVQIVGLCASATLAVLFATGMVHLWQVYLMITLLGCGWATDFSTRRALIAELHARERVVSALSLESMSMQGNKIVAALVSGLLLATGKPALCYGWLAIVYACNCLAVLRLRRQLEATPPEQSARSVRLPISVRDGLTIALRTPIVLNVLLITLVMNLLVFPYQQMLPVIGRDLLHVGPTQLGLLAGADGIGAIVVGAVLTRHAHRVRQRLLFVAGAFGVSLFVIVLVVSRVFAFSYATQIALGLCSGMFGGMQAGLILNNVEAHLRARAMGLLAMAIGASPFGILFIGLLSSAVGPTATITGMSLLAIALMAVIIARDHTFLTRRSTSE